MQKAIKKIDLIIEEAEVIVEEAHSPSLLNLGTNERRILAAKIHDLSDKERDRLGQITERLMIGVKNGLIDATLTSLLVGLSAAAAIGAGPTAAILGALTGAVVGVNSFNTSRETAFLANDLNKTMGKKEINKLVKELESFLGKPIVKLIKLDGAIRF